MSLYYLGNYRTAEQLADMQRLEAAGTCVFCPQHLARDRNQPVLHRTPHWTVTPNEFPYRGTRLHLLLVPDEHVTDLLDLPDEARQDMWSALDWVRQHYGLSFYSLAARNGDCEFTGATIRHVHLHLLQGDVENPDHEPVRTKLSSRPRAQAGSTQISSTPAERSTSSPSSIAYGPAK
jgi:diadenosine tetraphosphate (Ap4A) HIT family hydrolase